MALQWRPPNTVPLNVSPHCSNAVLFFNGMDNTWGFQALSWTPHSLGCRPRTQPWGVLDTRQAHGPLYHRDPLAAAVSVSSKKQDHEGRTSHSGA